MVRQIAQVIYYLKFTLNLILTLIFALCCMRRLTYTILYLLGRNWMDLMCTFCFWVIVGSTCLSVLKPLLLRLRRFWVLPRHMSPGALCGAAVSTAFAAGVSLVSILQACDWARVSTLARYYLSAQYWGELQPNIYICKIVQSSLYS